MASKLRRSGPGPKKQIQTSREREALNQAIKAAKSKLKIPSDPNSKITQYDSSDEEEDINPAFSKKNLRSFEDVDGSAKIIIPKTIEKLNCDEKVEDILELLDQLGDPDADIEPSDIELGECASMTSEDSLQFDVDAGEGEDEVADSQSVPAGKKKLNRLVRLSPKRNNAMKPKKNAKQRDQSRTVKKTNIKGPKSERSAPSPQKGSAKPEGQAGSPRKQSGPGKGAKPERQSSSGEVGAKKTSLKVDKMRRSNSVASPKKKVARRPFKKAGSRRKARAAGKKEA